MGGSNYSQRWYGRVYRDGEHEYRTTWSDTKYVTAVKSAEYVSITKLGSPLLWLMEGPRGPQDLRKEGELVSLTLLEHVKVVTRCYYLVL